MRFDPEPPLWEDQSRVVNPHAASHPKDQRPTPQNTQLTLRVTGDRVEVVTQRDSEPEERMTATMSPAGSTATFTTDCPSMTTYSFGYTASDTQFTHIIEGPDIRDVHVYALQQ